MTRAAVILAGGQARRMGGGHKALLALGAARVIDYILTRLTPQVDKIALNVNEDAEAFFEFDYPLLEDHLKGYLGPLAGVHTALIWAREIGADHVLTVAGDTPFFPFDLYERLEKGLKTHPISMAATGVGLKDRHPTFALWPTDAIATLETMLKAGTRKVINFSDALGCHRVLFEEDDPFFNINRPEDLNIAEKRLVR